MQKSLRSFVLITLVSLIASPALHADVMGTNPRPRIAVQSPSMLQSVLSFFRF